MSKKNVPLSVCSLAQQQVNNNQTNNNSLLSLLISIKTQIREKAT